MKTRIICFCSKSGVGKSTYIDSLGKNDKCYIVTSNTSREPRDEFDKKTHTFKTKEDYLYDKENNLVLSEYISPIGYVNWVSDSNFDKEKINLFAVDIENALNLSKNNNYDVSIIYLYCNEELRKLRLKNRNSSIEVYGEETHLDIFNYKIKFIECFDNVKIINTTDKSISKVINEILEKTNLLYKTFEMYSLSNKLIIHLLDGVIVLEDLENFEYNLKILLDTILIDYKDIGFAKFNDYEEIYIEYKDNLLSFCSQSREKDFYYYKLLLETVLKWKGGQY